VVVNSFKNGGLAGKKKRKACFIVNWLRLIKLHGANLVMSSITSCYAGMTRVNVLLNYL